MDKEVKIAALSLVALLAIIAIMQPIIFSNNNYAFSELAVLGPTPSPIPTCNQNQTELGNYPRSIFVGQFACLFGFIGNHQGSTQYYEFVTKLGNESTRISNSTAPANAPIIFTHYALLLNNQSSVFPIGSFPTYVGGLLTINDAGNNSRLIFELWSYDLASSAYEYTGLWNEIWINVTL